MDKTSKLKSREACRTQQNFLQEESFRATIETENSEQRQQTAKPRTNHQQRRWRKIDRVRTQVAADGQNALLTNKVIKSKLMGYKDKSLIQELFIAGVDSTSKLFDPSLDQTDQRMGIRRCTYNKRIPLLFLKPYSKFNSNRKTLEEVKSQLYSSVKRGDLQCSYKHHPIEYFTEYGDQQPPFFRNAKSQTLTPKRSPKLSLACNIFRHKNEQNKQLRSQSQNVQEKRIGAFYMNNFLHLL